MTIVSLSSIYQRLILVLPEPLNLGGSFVSSPDVGSPSSLNTGRHGVPVSIPLTFKEEQLEAISFPYYREK